MATILETPRLALREMTGDDLDFVAAMLADPDVMRFWPRPQTRDEAVDWVRRQIDRYAEYGSGYWVAVLKSTGEPIGQYGLLPPGPDLERQGVAEANLGYMTHRPHWRNGYAAEASAACLAYAFEVQRRDGVACLIRPENAPSLAVARSLGLTLEKERVVVLAGFDHWVFHARTPEGS